MKQADSIGSARAAGTARRAESITVNGANPGPGVAVVTFPAASTIFTARGILDVAHDVVRA